MSEHMNGYTCEDVEDALLDAQRDSAALTAELEAARAEIARLEARIAELTYRVDQLLEQIIRRIDERDALAERVRVLTEALREVAADDDERDGCSHADAAKAVLAAVATPAQEAERNEKAAHE